MHARLLLMLLMLGAATAPLAAASLRFVEVEREFRPTLLDEQVSGAFAFANAGDAPVTIVRVTTSCGCTTAVPAKTVYQPGETGTLDFVFHFGNRTGYQEKTILVATDAAGDPPIRLKLKVHIPQGMLIAPTFLSWPVGAPTTARTVDITLPLGSPLRLTAARASDSRLLAELKPGADPSSHILVITPTATDQPVRATIEILASDGSRTQVMAVIEPGLPPAPVPAPALPAP